VDCERDIVEKGAKVFSVLFFVVSKIILNFATEQYKNTLSDDYCAKNKDYPNGALRRFDAGNDTRR
jgi:hypothetical protein